MNKIASLNPKTFRLVYWPGIPGRGEPIRLAFEQAGVPYVDVALTDKAVSEVMGMCSKDFDCPLGNLPPLAPPILIHDHQILSQLPNIMLYLGPILGLVPKDPAGNPKKDEANKLKVNQLFLTASDLQNEAHDTHHPIAVGDYYEAQKTEAHRKSIDFRKNRMPKFLGYFNRVLTQAPSPPYLLGSTLSYADLHLYFVVSGLEHAFPNALKRTLASLPKVEELYKTVGDLPNIKAYLASDRRVPFADGVYRRYPELDVEADLEEKEKEKEEEEEDKKKKRKSSD